ncbi:hypothetical protein HPQ64_09010 [Rhizobiales bacterium]|uniref:hypothetical protein n=1 Tax=Hongsoonwoonella zoysiae TaxID=2821844 RepID=UPI0015604912|nr:hypothetical protein [Hongsoonwoonella zoysiae]NRG17828.1 hypothetical protein [Hongsoonwoonella zoysiae]
MSEFINFINENDRFVLFAWPLVFVLLVGAASIIVNKYSNGHGSPHNKPHKSTDGL